MVKVRLCREKAVQIITLTFDAKFSCSSAYFPQSTFDEVIFALNYQK
jgi:hypothetical protein